MTVGERSAVIELCLRVQASLPTLSIGVTERIRASLEDYRLVPFQEHAASVLEQQSRLVQALMETRAPNEEDLDRADALGRIRASQGVSVEALIGAYHIGNRLLWDTIVAEAGRGSAWIASLAGLMWESIEVTGARIAAAHSTVAKSQQAREIALRYRFTELLLAQQPGPEAAEAALALGFDPTGWFVVVVMEPHGSEVASPSEAAISATSGSGSGTQAPANPEQVVWTRQERSIIAVVQTPGALSAVSAISGIVEGHRAGVGLPRRGMVGACQSLVDARRCLALAGEARPIIRFDERWLEATLAADTGRLIPLVAQAVAVAAEQPHLREALTEFSRSGFSVAETGRRLHVHPNSVAYRLDRWRVLTGLDARTLDGLNRSLLAISMAETGALADAGFRAEVEVHGRG